MNYMGGLSRDWAFFSRQFGPQMTLMFDWYNIHLEPIIREEYRESIREMWCSLEDEEIQKNCR